ncbi:Molybdopterin oxidoreductase domain protein [Desulfamplus magnetovallimortis]|uniref:Molybdopterin oxidoreductase domain protein n=1 Tax=Desulfamplus magnetovallimortis TaxID=1246637 RepID=A0A1W1HF22_9BACT|nr:molybdopterin-dependent oxidoreductase [Desulfamplus magnetovallimortis]SLM31023.1 Molybdopterin oxidoreductase domain protein [Desulfamplus magnetovallimortis]
METISACTLDCQDSCSTVVRIDERNEKIPITINGNPNHPFTRGVICRKGRNTHLRLKSSERVTTPMLKQNGVFHQLSWDAALDMTAEKIEALRWTPASILHVRHYGYRGALSNGSKYLFNALGASTTRGALCDDAGCTAYMKDFGALEMNDPMDLLNADHIINWGKDLSRSSIHLADIIKQARQKGCRVTTISPGGDGNKKMSHRMICIRPGRDRFLAAAVIKIILERNLADPRAMANAKNLNIFKRVMEHLPLTYLLDACDCTFEDLEYLVSLFTETKKNNVENRESRNKSAVAILMGWGIQRYRFGGQTVRYLNALSFLSGHVGQSGGGTYFNISSGRNINSKWVSDAGTPARTILLPRIGKEIMDADPPIEFLLADGSNFVNQAPDATTTIKAMAKIPFKVVIDAFMTDTASCSDLVLPCALDYEREEIAGSCLHNYVNYAAPVFSPSGDARCDFDIMSDLASRLKIVFPRKESVLLDSLNNPFLSHLGGPDKAIKEIRENGFVKALHPNVAWRDLIFAHPDGKYRLPESFSHEDEAGMEKYVNTDKNYENSKKTGKVITGKETINPIKFSANMKNNWERSFPMNLLSLVNRDYMHSQIPESDQKGMPDVWINPASPHLHNIDKSRPIYIATPLGRMAVQLNMLENLHPLALIIRRGGWLKHNRCINTLIEPEITDIGETAAYYSQCARLEN